MLGTSYELAGGSSAPIFSTERAYANQTKESIRIEVPRKSYTHVNLTYFLANGSSVINITGCFEVSAMRFLTKCQSVDEPTTQKIERSNTLPIKATVQLH